MKQTPNTKVVPFRGEMYPEPEPASPVKPLTGFPVVLFGCLCLIGMGAAVGATVTYNSPEQVQFREMQQQLQQFTTIKKQLCK